MPTSNEIKERYRQELIEGSLLPEDIEDLLIRAIRDGLSLDDPKRIALQQLDEEVNPPEDATSKGY